MKPLVLAVAALLASPVLAATDPSFDGGKSAARIAPADATAAPAPVARGSGAGSDQRLWVVVPAADQAARSAVARAGVSIEEVTPSRVSGIAGLGAAARLASAGIRFTAQPLDARFRVQDFPQEDSAFHDYDRMAAQLKVLAGEAPQLASVFSIGQSLQGRELLALRLNSSAQGTAPSDKPGVLFLGTHHAREHLSTEVPLLLAQYLIENRSKPEIASLLASRDVYIVPMVNPDGVEHDIEGGQYHMHRKNMRPLAGGGFGVDLNRN